MTWMIHFQQEPPSLKFKILDMLVLTLSGMTWRITSTLDNHCQEHREKRSGS